MIYAIKANNEIVYLGRVEESQEAWDAEYNYHKEKFEQRREELYIALTYWKNMDRKKITMQILDSIDEDEDRAYATLICALKPFGNVDEWERKE